MARSHIKLWWGDLVISNKASRHAEERNGEVSAFMFANICFAWWSNEQLKRLAERKLRDKEAEEAKWSGVRGPGGPMPPADDTS